MLILQISLALQLINVNYLSECLLREVTFDTCLLK